MCVSECVSKVYVSVCAGTCILPPFYRQADKTSTNYFESSLADEVDGLRISCYKKSHLVSKAKYYAGNLHLTPSVYQKQVLNF